MIDVKYVHEFELDDGQIIKPDDEKITLFLPETLEEKIVNYYKNICFIKIYEDVILVNKNEKYGYMDKAWREIIPIIYDKEFDICEGAILARKNDKYDNMDKNEKSIIYDKVFRFRDGIVRVEKNGKWGYIDKTGKETIPIIYDFARNFKERLALVVKENYSYGFIDKTGKEMVPCLYDYVENFKEGLGKVYINDKVDYVDRTGKLLSEQIINNRLDFIEENTSKFTNFYYSIAYDIENNKLLKVKNVKKFYQIEKDGKTMVLDTEEIDNAKKLVR